MSLAPLVAQIVLNSFVRPRRKQAEFMKAELALFALAGLLSLAGSVLLIVALYYALAVYYAPPLAALIAGLALYVLALLIVFTAKMLVKRKPVVTQDAPSVEDQVQTVAKLIESALAACKREIDTPVQENPATSLLVASIAGFLAARQFR